jgi:hypothetical protein
LLTSSSYLTFSNWSGYIGYLPNAEIQQRITQNGDNVKQSPLMLSSLKVNLNIRSGVTNTRWASDEEILVGTDFGEISLYKLNKTNNNLESNKFNNLMIKREHDDLITSLDVKFNENFAISGSEDSRYFYYQAIL